MPTEIAILFILLALIVVMYFVARSLRRRRRRGAGDSWDPGEDLPIWRDRDGSFDLDD